jgi:Domain of unknown function (DUF4184)
MPFTFSHPAIILPLTYLPKGWFSLTGLVVGSCIPDFEYFLRMGVESRWSHSIEGIFVFDLPVGILFCFVFHCMIRNALFENLPFVLKARLMPFTTFNWTNHFQRNWLMVIVSVLIGASSHVFWDSFTHAHRFFTDAIPELNNRMFFGPFSFPWHYFLQHLSTVVGGYFVFMYLWKLPVEETVNPGIKHQYWSTFFIFCMLIFCLRVSMGVDYNNIIEFIMIGLATVIYSLAITPFVLKSRFLDRT